MIVYHGLQTFIKQFWYSSKLNAALTKAWLLARNLADENCKLLTSILVLLLLEDTGDEHAEIDGDELAEPDNLDDSLLFICSEVVESAGEAGCWLALAPL